MTLNPLGDRVLVKPCEADSMTKGGIVIPDTAKEKPTKGKILAVGPGKKNDEGKLVEPNVKDGDVVLYERYAGTEVKIDGEEAVVVRESEILAIINDDSCCKGGSNK